MGAVPNLVIDDHARDARAAAGLEGRLGDIAEWVLFPEPRDQWRRGRSRRRVGAVPNLVIDGGAKGAAA